MTIRLKAAEPTIVEGPSSPGVDPSVEIVSMMESRISGALEPSAMSVRFAMVGFQTLTVAFYLVPFSSTYSISFVCDVMTSIEPMKMSEMIEMPRNRYTRAKK